MPETNYEVIAHVSPRSLGPKSLFVTESAITTENVQEYNSDPVDIRDAKRELNKAGFHVFEEGSSDATIAIGGSAELFRDFSSTKLTKQKAEIRPRKKCGRGHVRYRPLSTSILHLAWISCVDHASRSWCHRS